jgi:hypothetical protein
MITNKTFKKLGFKWDEYTNGFVHPEDPNRTWTVDDSGIIYIREGSNYHGMSFSGVRDYLHIIPLFFLLTGIEMKL